MKRREARDSAFLLIFEKSFKDEPIDEIIENAELCRGISLDDYAAKLVNITVENIDELDRKIEQHLSNWKLPRLPKVTLAALRIAFCELNYFPDIPVRVSINEAIDLAKKYGTEDDASYVNGVLGSYVKEFTPVKDVQEEIVDDDKKKD